MRFILACILAAIAPASTVDEKRPVRVLFVGNSYTHMNDLPRLTARLAASARPPRAVETELVAEGGATLERHWKAGRALEAIRNGKWNYVVLQEQGTLGPSDDFRTINDPAVFHTYARLFDDEIRKAGAKTLFFMTWARQDSPDGLTALARAYNRLQRLPVIRSLLLLVGPFFMVVGRISADQLRTSSSHQGT